VGRRGRRQKGKGTAHMGKEGEIGRRERDQESLSNIQ